MSGVVTTSKRRRSRRIPEILSTDDIVSIPILQRRSVGADPHGDDIWEPRSRIF